MILVDERYQHNLLLKLPIDTRSEMARVLDVIFHDKIIFLPLLSTMPPVSLGCGIWPPPVPLFIASFCFDLDLWCACAEILA